MVGSALLACSFAADAGIAANVGFFVVPNGRNYRHPQMNHA